MILKKIVLQNYKGFYGLHTLDFTTCDVTMISGGGGSGKSTLIEAISWLFNKNIQASEKCLPWRLLTIMSTDEHSQVSVSMTFEQNGLKEAKRTLYLEKTDAETINILSDEHKLYDNNSLKELDFDEYTKTYMKGFIRSLSITKDWNHDFPYQLRYQLDSFLHISHIKKFQDLIKDLDEITLAKYQKEKLKEIQLFGENDSQNELIDNKYWDTLEEIIYTLIKDPEEVKNIPNVEEVNLLTTEISLSKLACQIELISKSAHIPISNLKEQKSESKSSSLVRKLVRYTESNNVINDNDIIEQIIKLTKIIFSASLEDLQSLRLILLHSFLHQLYLLDTNKKDIEIGETIRNDLSLCINNNIIKSFGFERKYVTRICQLLLYQEFLQHIYSYIELLIINRPKQEIKKIETSFNIYAKTLFHKDLSLKIINNTTYGEIDFLLYTSKTNYYLPTPKELQLVYFTLRIICLPYELNMQDSSIPIISDFIGEFSYYDEIDLYNCLSLLKRQVIITSHIPFTLINNKTTPIPLFTVYILKKNMGNYAPRDISFEIIKYNPLDNRHGVLV